jgi:beta-glucosidase
VQVYASRPDSSLERPVRWLAGFTPAELGAGESATVDVPVAARAFEHWDTATGRWTLESGTFRLDVGRSSRELLLSTEITVGPS